MYVRIADVRNNTEESMMAKSVFMVWTNPIDEASDSEFNDWYSRTHVPQVVEHVPGVTGARRYRVVDLPGAGGAPAHRYVCVWETDTNDAASVAAGLQAAIEAGKLDMTPAMDVTANPPLVQWFESVEG
jgi:hypothetical protein